MHAPWTLLVINIQFSVWTSASVPSLKLCVQASVCGCNWQHFLPSFGSPAASSHGFAAWFKFLLRPSLSCWSETELPEFTSSRARLRAQWLRADWFHTLKLAVRPCCCAWGGRTHRHKLCPPQTEFVQIPPLSNVARPLIQERGVAPFRKKWEMDRLLRMVSQGKAVFINECIASLCKQVGSRN